MIVAVRDVRVRMQRRWRKENLPTAMEHQVTEEPGDRSVHVEGSKPGARRRKGELADCNGTSSHLGTRCRSWLVEGSKPGGTNGNGVRDAPWRPDPSIDAEATIACAAFRGGLSAVSPRGKNLLYSNCLYKKI